MNTWTPKQLGKAINMWNSGKSSREIGLAFNITRNAAIGRLHRAKGFVARAPANYQRPKKIDSAPEFIPETPVPVASQPPVSLKYINDDMCHYPEEPFTEDFLMCGAKVDGNSMYCSYHKKIVYEQNKKPHSTKSRAFY